MMRNKILLILITFFCILIFNPIKAQRPAPPNGLRLWLTGDGSDATVDLSQGPALLLMGGGVEVDAGFRDQAFPMIPNADVVVLRASGSDGYNDYLYQELTTGPNQPNSVETIRFDNRNESNSEYVKWVIDTAELIWFAGGDQSDYLNLWVGTEVQYAVQRAWDRGAVIGGTSAGLAILGEQIYDPDNVSAVVSSEILANAGDPNLNFSPQFLNTPFMTGIITDTHFENRDRMGRSIGFLANTRNDLSGIPAVLSINERTSVFLTKDGVGKVLGSEHAYLIRESNRTEWIGDQAGQPLQVNQLLRYKVGAGGMIDFKTRTATVAPMILNVDGSNSNDPYSPSDPYANVTSVPIEGHHWLLY